jgi:hypothetical protein
MSHVDDGALHAYLDGALDEGSSSEARRIREHLEECAACTRRLQEERAVRERADTILGLAVPALDLPPLEELRARARTQGSSPARGAGRLRRMGWAASIVVAVGAGWMLRGQSDSSDGTAGPMQRSAESSAAAPASELGGLADVAEPNASTGRMGSGGVAAPGGDAARAGGEAALGDAAGAGDAAPFGAAPVGPRPPEVAMRRGATPPGADAPLPALALEEVRIAEVAGDSGGAAAGAGEAAARSKAAPGDPRRAAPASRALRYERVAERAAAPSGAPSASGGAAGARAETGVDAAAGERVAAVLPAERTPIEIRPTTFEETPAAATATDTAAVPGAAAYPAESAARDLRAERVRSALDVDGIGEPAATAFRERAQPDEATGGPPAPGSLVVPGLEVLSIVWREEGVTPAGVRVLQRTEEGDTLELLHLPEGVDPASVPVAQPPLNELVVLRGTGWLILRAPLEREELRGLLARLDSIR